MAWIEWMSGRPAHIWVGILVILLLGGISLWRRRWPSAEHVIELGTLGAGIWGGAGLFYMSGSHSSEEKSAWFMMIGGITVLVASGAGFVNLLGKIAAPTVPVQTQASQPSATGQTAASGAAGQPAPSPTINPPVG